MTYFKDLFWYIPHKEYSFTVPEANNDENATYQYQKQYLKYLQKEDNFQNLQKMKHHQKCLLVLQK